MSRKPELSVRRTGALAVVAVVHAALLALLLTRPVPPPPRSPGVEAMVLRLIAAPPPAPAPFVLPPPDVADPVSALVRPVAPVIAIVANQAVGEPWTGGACTPVDAIGRALAADPVARDAIAHAPPGLRSDAGAIALWNGGWADAASARAAPLAPVRAAVERTLAAAPPACLDISEIGPRLVIVQGAARPTLLVLGSGEWRWRDLIPM